MQILDGLEALLFVADGPVSLSQLAVALGVTEGQTEQAIEILQKRYESSGPLQLVQIAGGYQICTKPEYATLVADFLKPNRQKLSKSLMEVLAIIAYQQPITLPEIEQVRGVQSDYSVKILLERRLIREMGRKKAAGRPMLYCTTQQFLHSFNLKSLEDLPPLSPDTPMLPVNQLKMQELAVPTDALPENLSEEQE